MGRPSLRADRRGMLTAAFARVLARHGFAGATIVAVADEADVTPGLVHHYFTSKQDLMTSLVSDLVARFRSRTRALESDRDALDAYVEAAVALGDGADVVAARCWVGVFAEAIREPALFDHVRRLLDAEIQAIKRRSGGRLGDQEAGAILALVVGALVLGAFAPRRTAGFAAPAMRALVAALRAPTPR